MADLRTYELHVALGKNSTSTARTGTSLARKWWPVDIGGNEVEGQPNIRDIPTQHAVKGVKYRVLASRNNQTPGIRGPFFPELASLLHLTGTHADYHTNNIPHYYQMVVPFGLTANLGVSVSGNALPDLGEDKRGLLFKTFALAFDREDEGAHITLSLTSFLNADRRIAQTATTSTDVETAGSDKTFTVVSSAGFSVGDFVTIFDADNAVTTEGQINLIADSTSIRIATLADNVDGSGATALAITKVIDTPVDPTINPYPATNTFVDFDVGKAGWSGDNDDVVSVDIEYDNDMRVKGFNADASDNDLNQTWTRVVDGPNASARGNIRLTLAQDAYPNYKRAAGVQDGRLRIMGYAPEADSTTTLNAETAADSVVVEVVAADAFTVGEYVLLDDGTNQAVAKIDAKDDGADTITLDTLDVNIGSGATVVNMAWEIKVHDLDIQSSSIDPGEDNVNIAISWAAAVEAGQTTLVTTKAYDHV